MQRENKEKLYHLLSEAAAAYPLSEPIDIIKLLFQRVFGGGHLIRNAGEAKQRLLSEWNETPKSPAVPRIERIGGGMARVHLAALSEAELTPLARLFILDANRKSGSPADFTDALAVARACAGEKMFRFSAKEFDEAVRDHLAGGIRPVSHSEIYRRAYRPAYRVMDVQSALLIPAAARIGALLASASDAVTVGIDGRCASGKSTAAEILGELFSASVLHMDDFFLPPEKRTEERCAIPGGNVDSERFSEEVLPFLHSGKEFSYCVFSCLKRNFDGVRTVSPASVIIVEGAYSTHPFFGDPYDLRIFFDTPYETQCGRILARNGERMLNTFKTRWIPLEEAYFSAFSIENRCDLTVRT